MRRAWGAVLAAATAVAATECISQDDGSVGGGLDAGSLDGSAALASDASNDATTGIVNATDDAVPAPADAGTDASDSTAPTDAGADGTTPTDAAEAGLDAALVDAGGDAGPDAATTNFALLFDDTSQAEYVAVPDTALLDIDGSFTMEAWVNLTGGGHSGSASVLSKPYGPNQVDTTELWFSSTTLYAAVNLGGTSGADSYTWTLPNGTWHHVAWTYDGASQVETLYVDGAFAAQQTSTVGVALFDGHPLLIGADIDNGGVTYGFYGAIDDVRVFAAARTPGQIDDDMARVSPLGDPTLVAYYTFDEGAGTVAHDSSGNHLDGTLGGAPDAGGAAPAWIASALPVVGVPLDAGPTQGTDAGLEKVLAFDPSIHPECVTVPDNAALDVATTLTYEAWIDPVDGAGSGIYSLLGKPYGAGDQDSVALWFQGGTLYASVNGANTSGALSYAWSFAANTWHHVAFTYASAGAATLYVDGASVATATSGAGAAVYDTSPLVLGADIDGLTYQYGFLGFEREVRIFGAVRTQPQIASDMSGASPVGDSTLIAYYPLDEGTGTVAHDLSANHLDGTFGALDGGVASPLWVSAPGPF